MKSHSLMFTLAYICSFRYISELNVGFYFICDSDSKSVSLPPSLSLSHTHRHTHKLFPIGTKTKNPNRKQTGSPCKLCFQSLWQSRLVYLFPSLPLLPGYCVWRRKARKERVICSFNHAIHQPPPRAKNKNMDDLVFILNYFFKFSSGG